MYTWTCSSFVLVYYCTDCKKDLSAVVPTLPSSVRCNIASYCTGVTCCFAESSVLGTHFRVGVHLDDCNHVLTINVEQLTLKIELNGYNFGKSEYMQSKVR